MRTTFESICRSRVKDIVEKMDEIVSKLQHAPSVNTDKYGCIIADVGIVDFSDVPGQHVHWRHRSQT